MKFIYEEKQKRHLLEFSILNGKFMHMNGVCRLYISYQPSKWPQTVFQLAHNDCNYQWHFCIWKFKHNFDSSLRSTKTALCKAWEVIYWSHALKRLIRFPRICDYHKGFLFIKRVNNVNMARGLHTFFSMWSALWMAI